MILIFCCPNFSSKPEKAKIVDYINQSTNRKFSEPRRSFSRRFSQNLTTTIITKKGPLKETLKKEKKLRGGSSGGSLQSEGSSVTSETSIDRELV